MKKKIILLLITSSLVVSLTGCSDIKVREEFILVDSSVSETAAPAETERPAEAPEVTEAPLEVELSPVQELELKYSSGEFQSNDLRSLGALYLEQGQVKKGRDMLETALLFYGEEETKALLSDITVNVAEESEVIQEKMQQLANNFEIPEMEDEVVSVMLANDWYDIMLPEVMLESRSYYLQQGEALYFVKVAKNENAKKYTTITRTVGDAVTVVRMEGSTLQRVDTQLKNGCYDGVFESWLVDKNTSDIIHETGTFAEGKLTGDYTVEVRWGSDPSDFFTLWTSRENRRVMTYVGNFDENGITNLDQSKASKVKRTAGAGGDNPIIYAQTTDGKRCLFINGAEGQTAEQIVFDVTTFNMPTAPAFETYEPVVEEESTAGILQLSQSIESEQLKVRVFDGQIQIFDGTSWYNMGSVDSYVQQDPMADRRAQAIAEAIAKAEEQQREEEQQSDVSIRSAGSVAAAAPAPTATKKPSTRPAVTAAPVVTAAPTQAPAQQPSNPQPQQPTVTEAPVTPAPVTPEPVTPAPPTEAPITPPPATEAPTQAPTDAPSGDTDAEFTPDMM